jgi:hypothetical protein
MQAKLKVTAALLSSTCIWWDSHLLNYVCSGQSHILPPCQCQQASRELSLKHSSMQVHTGLCVSCCCLCLLLM